MECTSRLRERPADITRQVVDRNVRGRRTQLAALVGEQPGEGGIDGHACGVAVQRAATTSISTSAPGTGSATTCTVVLAGRFPWLAAPKWRE